MGAVGCAPLGTLGAKVVDDHLDGLRFAVLDHGELTEIAAENHTQRLHVGDVEIAEAGNRDVELQGIDIATEDATVGAAFQDVPQLVDEWRVKGGDVLESLQEPCILQVFNGEIISTYPLQYRMPQYNFRPGEGVPDAMNMGADQGGFDGTAGVEVPNADLAYAKGPYYINAGSYFYHLDVLSVAFAQHF